MAQRLRELRKRLDLTQDEVATRGGFADRVEITRLENGWNLGTGAATRQKLAKAFGLSLEKAFAYFDGNLALDDAANACAHRAPKRSGED